MTEIGEAAKRKACELANAERKIDHDYIWKADQVDWNPVHSNPASHQAIIALARYIETTSDVARAALHHRLHTGFEDSKEAAALESLILPDEPCDHLLNVCNLRALDAANPHLRCYKCGKALKIVEAGDV